MIVIVVAVWAVVLGVVFGLRRPEGIRSRVARSAVAVLTGGSFVVAVGLRNSVSSLRLTIAVVLCTLVAIVVFRAEHRVATAADRARLLWVGWGVLVVAGVVGAAGLLQVLLGWPNDLAAFSMGAALVVPIALLLGSFEGLVSAVDRTLVLSIEAGGIVVMVGLVYLLVVLGFGNAPDSAQRRVLGLSMIAAAIASLGYALLREPLADFANRRVYGRRQAPDEALRTFGARMSRSIALDELLLQLAESLQQSLRLRAAEVWTGTDGLLERAAAVPDRGARRVRLNAEELPVVARSHVSGNAWMQVWLPGILAEHEGRVVRVAPMAHSGELLGLLVCARAEGDVAFTEEEERVLSELARQVGLALHNSRLDSALQASLDDLRVANEELSASRARIVAAADQSRRQIERNLHDGAQQHLVALAVKLGLARQILEADPAAVAGLLEELRHDAQETLTELRELAHGIYPPLLMDRGLGEALRAAANRAVLPTEVTADVGRYDSEVEAAIYFCCLEAMQNAGKHAGDGAHLSVVVREADAELCFEVADDGAGFDATHAASNGHGFVNMTDRLGAIGGSLEVDSAPGRGTRIRGHVRPLVH